MNCPNCKPSQPCGACLSERVASPVMPDLTKTYSGKGMFPPMPDVAVVLVKGKKRGRKPAKNPLVTVKFRVHAGFQEHVDSKRGALSATDWVEKKCGFKLPN